MDQPAGEEGGSERRRGSIDWEADRTEDRALLGSNLSAAPVAEIGSGGGNPFPHLLHGGTLRGPPGFGFGAYLGT